MSNVSVLIVDDAPFIRDLVKKALRSHFPGLQIEEAVNGRKAQQVLSRTGFDLILCDWEMPEMSGLELLQWFRAQPDQGSTPFVMVTSRGDKENVVEAIQAGVSDYIGKPFSNEQLIAKVKKALQRAGKLAQLQAPRPRASTGSAIGSVANLTGGRQTSSPVAPAPAPAPAPAAASPPRAAQPAPTPPAAEQAGGQRVRGQAQLRLAGEQFACVIKHLSLRDALVVVRRGERLPQVFESGVLDLEQDADRSVARINGYVHAVAALEAKVDCDWVKVTLKFVDQDPEKLDYLSRLIASGTAQAHYSPSA
ncbi:two-component system response regulator [Halopseudomonas pachastrellae]|uniref:Two-component system response regulator n=1 Tax=Halopseudomonas pachastrellae TaxID=254161 RepID=A0A1S8DJL0_9GAMM|nr:response regulator [Halopseudomonas pachastrellae]ONM45618.1 two-component system response regulator [Halopseudomonas pachastrellae]SFM24554.1 Response regulator receiver domain-containing protein [Halopseudomonas pachastrellae]